jgi:hypothetical protein
LATEAIDTRVTVLDKTTRRRLKREAFLLKMETASMQLKDRTAAPVPVDIPVNDLKVGVVVDGKRRV